MSSLRRLTHPAYQFSPILHLACLGLFSTLCLTVPAHAAASADEAIPTPEVLAQLELRAAQADPREQVFLYTQLVHTMTQKAGKEIADGDTDAAAATLKKVNQYATPHPRQSRPQRQEAQGRRGTDAQHHLPPRPGPPPRLRR